MKRRKKKQWQDKEPYALGTKIFVFLCIVVMIIGILAWPVLVIGSAFVASLFGLAKKS